MIIFKIRGVVRERETGHPLPGLVVKAYDKDLRFDDVLGSAVSGELGRFEILSELADFRELFETRPDIYFKVFRQSGTLLYAADDAVAWDSSQLSESIVDVPAERLHEADPPRLVLAGTDGTRREEFSPGEALTVAMTGLRPSALYDLKVSADGRELFTSRLLTDRRGEIEPTVLWPQMGFDDPNSQAIYTPAEALARWGGRSVELTVGSDEKVIAAQRFRFGRQFAEPLVLATDHEGRLVNGFEAGAQPVYVTVAGLPFSGRVRIYLVQRQHDWNTGDAFTAVLTREADVTAEPTTVELAASVAPGAYDFIVRPVRYGYEEDDEPRLLAADIVGGRRTTGLVVREGFWTAKPVLGGCVNKIAVSGRTVSGAPYFQYADTFEVGEDVYAALDPGIVDPGNLSKMCAFYLIANKTDAQWNADNSLNHLLGGNGAVQKIKVQTGCVNGNKILLWPAANTVGEYDIVADFGNNTPDAATFMPNNQYNTPLDVIDGYFVAGFRVVQDPGTLSDPGLFAGSWSYDPATVAALGLPGTVTVDDETWYYPTPGGFSVVSRQVQMRANVFFPADSAGVTDPAQISASKPDYPLAVVVHGNGHDYQSYDFLLQHLARNGFIAISIDNRYLDGVPAHGMHGLGRANNFFAHLAVVQAKFGAKVQNSIGVMGHSRGGEAVAKIARLNHQQALGHNINAVMSLAPTDQYGRETLAAPYAKPYFVLYGSRDGDVSGEYSSFTQSLGFDWRMTGFSLYDRASGAPKSMAFVYRASHNGFITTNSDAFDVTISETAQKAVTLAYTNAFFRQHLRGETQWQGMFEGAWKPASVTSAGVELYVQHRKPGSQTVDDFQTVPTWQGSSSGGVVDHGGSLPIDPREGRLVNVGPTPGLDPHSPHDSKGLEIKWDGLGDRLVWTIPPGQGNVSAFSVLSLRVTQREASPVNPPGLAQDFRVKLRDANGNERAIRASAFGSIPYPDQRLDSELNKSAMSTIRIPMTAYTIVCAGQPKVDLTQVTEFSLDFSLKATGHIQVDDIEFTS